MSYIDKRISGIREALENAQLSANEETKSSAGDKYETGRSMIQIEIENHSKQLGEALLVKSKLERLNISQPSDAVNSGSLVFTNHGNFFIAISVGKLVVGETSFTAIAPESPIGKKLLGMRKGESFSFNGKTFTIERLE